ncbi:hypothetical protein PG991_010441 [Apiospora marii]|uniref:Uncharacterized protein n=1 Tax=Apiospora marii TaxID=335849 RepID=A0ABR1RIH6_9PEZI
MDPFVHELMPHLPRYVQEYAFFASNGVCNHRHDRQLEHAQDQQPLYYGSIHDSDPAPVRHGSLRHDYYTALPEDVDPAEALMDDDTLPPVKVQYDDQGNVVRVDDDEHDGQPVWRPEYDVCLDDLLYHLAVYRAIPPLRALALHVFKQCLVSFVPLRWSGPAIVNNYIEEGAFGALVRDIYEHTAEGDGLRVVCARFGVWVQARCGPRRRRRPVEWLAHYLCVEAARRACGGFDADVAEGGENACGGAAAAEGEGGEEGGGGGEGEEAEKAGKAQEAEKRV